MRVTTSQCAISCKNHIWSVKTFPLEHNLPVGEKKNIFGTSSILARGKSSVLPTDPPFFFTIRNRTAAVTSTTQKATTTTSTSTTAQPQPNSATVRSEHNRLFGYRPPAPSWAPRNPRANSRATRRSPYTNAPECLKFLVEWFSFRKSFRKSRNFSGKILYQLPLLPKFL